MVLTTTFHVTFIVCKKTFFTATNLCSFLIVRAKQFEVFDESISIGSAD